MHLPDLCANGAAVMVTAHTATSIINTAGVAISEVLILKLVLRWRLCAAHGVNRRACKIVLNFAGQNLKLCPQQLLVAWACLHACKFIVSRKPLNLWSKLWFLMSTFHTFSEDWVFRVYHSMVSFREIQFVIEAWGACSRAAIEYYHMQGLPTTEFNDSIDHKINLRTGARCMSVVQ